MVASKRDAIAAIIEMNPTANPAFLSEFSKSDLEHYLDRLGRAIGADDDNWITRERPASSPGHTPDDAQLNDSRW